MRTLQRLLIVSSVIHYRHDGRLFAYGPYAREIDIWADLFPEIAIAAPCREGLPLGDCLSFTRENIIIIPQLETGGTTLRAKLTQILLLPWLVWGLIRAMWQADAIHVRCPGNLGLLGIVLARLFSKYRVAKYSNQWNSYSGAPYSYRFQRWLLRSPWWGAPVTVYGNWPDQPPQVIPSFTSMMTKTQVTHATKVAACKRIDLPLRVLFSGRLLRAKRAHVLLDAIQLATNNGLPLELTVVGDGPERAILEKRAKDLSIADSVTFVGGIPFDQSLRWYEWAHVLVLPSLSEGWPKVIAEAMSYGLACIAVNHGQIPAMLNDRGIMLQRGTSEEIADALQRIASHQEEATRMAQRAAAWAQSYSLEGLRDELAGLLTHWWGIPTLSPSIGDI